MGQGRFLYIILSVLYVIEVSRQFISQFSSYTPVNLFLRGEIIQICDQLELLFLSIALTPPPRLARKLHSKFEVSQPISIFTRESI